MKLSGMKIMSSNFTENLGSKGTIRQVQQGDQDYCLLPLEDRMVRSADAG